MSLFPSRLNPRLPQTKKGNHDSEDSYSHLFGENNHQTKLFLGDPMNDNTLQASLISSLIEPRTPLDLIQVCFL
jgi:hypothetical protein